MLALAGCSGAGTENASKNHSNNANTAELFTIPPDQMAHVQVLAIEPSSLTRTLRLTGAVAYNSFHTAPVITQVSGPVSRIVVAPGQQVQRGEPLLYVASPDYSQLRTNYLKAKDAYAWRKKRMRVRKTCISITPSPNKIWSRLNPCRRKRKGTWRQQKPL